MFVNHRKAVQLLVFQASVYQLPALQIWLDLIRLFDVLQLMEAANASDEERDGGGSFEMRAPKRARCYAAGPPRIAKAGILV